MSSRLFWRIFVCEVIGMLGVATALSIVIPARLRATAAEQARSTLDALVPLFRADAAAVLSGTAPRLSNELAGLQREIGVRIAVIGEDGTVLFDSNPANPHKNFLGLPEIIAAKKTGTGRFHHLGSNGRVPKVSVAERVGSEEKLVGYLLVTQELGEIATQIAATRRRIWVVVGLCSAILLAVTWWIAATIRRPLGMLKSAAQQMGEGDFDREVPLERSDELGALARAFQAMRDNVRGRIEELEERGALLEENSERLSTVLAGMIEGVIALDNSERILFLNRAARAFLDVTGSNIVGRPIWEVIRHPALQETVRDALQGGELRTGEFELPRLQAIVALIVSRLPGDPCPGVVLVLHDVTELRRLENLRSEFVSNVSHELKTPLAAIQAYAETLLAGALDDPQHNREFLHRIEEQGERLHSLVLDLLQLARIESGADVFDITMIDVQDVIEGCFAEHAAGAEANGLSLKIEPPDQALRVRADKEGLRTILDNLIGNAIKYTPAGGLVTVRWAQDDGRVLIAVKDSGVGIPESQQARIFERFYRIDKARSRELGGTGLGLSIVKHLVQVFGGSVAVESRAGHGSTFIVRLPRG